MVTLTPTPDFPPRQLLKRLAGAKYFERGEDYYDRGFVFDSVVYQGTLTAKVRGSYQSSYRVKLIWNGESLDHDCSCPLGDEGEFCKHCVAVGLTWLDLKEDASEASSNAKTPSVSMEDVKTYLKQQKPDVLVEMLMQQAIEDDRLREKLLIKTAKSTQGKDLNLQQFKKALEKAIRVRDFVDYYHMRAYAAGIDAVTESLQELLKEGYTQETIDLTEYALSLLEDSLNSMDDSAGYMTGIMETLETLHHDACKQGQPKIEPLVKRLFAWQIRTEWDTFSNVLEDYADVFGKEGISLYRRLAEAEWEKVPALKPGDKDSEKYGRRYRITQIMDSLAKQAGDIEAVVAVRERDLSEPYDFLRIAHLYRDAGLPQKALVWAEKGVHAFPGKTDHRLHSFLIEAYHQCGNHRKTLELAWQAFTESPNLSTYQKLKTYTAQQDDWEDPWPPMRVKALAFIREEIQKNHQSRKSSYAYTQRDGQPNQTELIKILLWEGDVQTAWEEAQQGWCPNSLWIELAQKREENHPADALKIYQDQVEPTLAIKNNTAYQQAIRYLVKIKELMTRLKKQTTFKKYLNDIRATHKAKRNFIKFLDAEKGL